MASKISLSCADRETTRQLCGDQDRTILFELSLSPFSNSGQTGDTLTKQSCTKTNMQFFDPLAGFVPYVFESSNTRCYKK